MGPDPDQPTPPADEAESGPLSGTTRRLGACFLFLTYGMLLLGFHPNCVHSFGRVDLPSCYRPIYYIVVGSLVVRGLVSRSAFWVWMAAVAFLMVVLDLFLPSLER
jgi:hypothetical protein